MSPPPRIFDADTISQTVSAISVWWPQAAQLIEDLWAELQRVTAPEYVAPVPMTEKDHHGPFLGKPEVEVEFFDTDKNTCGSSTVGLELRINDRGILIVSETRVAFTVPRRIDLGGYRVWVGSDMLEAIIPPVTLHAGETYSIALNVPIRLGRGIGHNPDDDSGPPRPMPHDPQTTKENI